MLGADKSKLGSKDLQTVGGIWSSDKVKKKVTRNFSTMQLLYTCLSFEILFVCLFF